MKFRHRYLLFLSCCSLFLQAIAQPKFKGSRENLGKEINDEFDQVRPVFSVDGNILYFSQGSGKNLQYEVWHALTDSMGRITGKQNIKGLNPITNAPKFVLQSLSSHRFLISGVYDVDASRLQYSRGISTVDISKAGNVFTPSLFAKQSNPVLDSIFRKRNIFPSYNVFSRAFYWSDNSDGQSDLFVLPIGSNGALSPIKLPAVINTKYNELTPWLDDESRYLYFASDRPGGFGGTDIWVSERMDESYLNWSSPVNLGPAVNTNKSESYFLLDPGNAYAYVCSDKNGFGRNDIYRIALGQPDSSMALSPIILPTDKPDTSLLFQPEKHLTNNIVFLLDISHSMAQSRKMITLKKAMYRLAQQLRPSDRISIVTFGSGVEVLLSPQWVKSKADIFDAIQSLAVNGGATNISAGLQRSYEQADQSFLPDGNNQLILVTDGVFALKPADEKLIFSHNKILFTAVVVGNDVETSKLLAPLVEKASGQMLHMENEAASLNLLLQNVRMNALRKN